VKGEELERDQKAQVEDLCLPVGTRVHFELGRFIWIGRLNGL